jgi:hypothetical protein
MNESRRKKNEIRLRTKVIVDYEIEILEYITMIDFDFEISIEASSR